MSSGRAIDLILGVLAVEFAVLVLRKGRRGSPLDVAFALAPGAALALALRAALTGAGWTWVAAFVALSLPLHLTDLWRRRL